MPANSFLSVLSAAQVPANNSVPWPLIIVCIILTAIVVILEVLILINARINNKYLGKFLDGVLGIFGIKRNSKYVGGYLNEANMRSGIYMSAVIFILEIWLVIRQTNKYVIDRFSNPKYIYGPFQVFYMFTSNYWLLMMFGLAMMFYCLYYLSKKSKSRLFLITLIVAGIALVLCCLFPLEILFTNSYNEISGKALLGGFDLGMLIALYASVFLFAISLVIACIHKYKGGRNQIILSVVVISLFALTCLIFGVKTSYTDFAGTKVINGEVVANPDYKGIICFLMFSMYIGCLLIWKPYISVGILGAIFLGFYLVLKGVTIRKFPEGDEINYLTFFISLTMICISIYNQRVSEAKKDEELLELATKDKLTGLLGFEYFTEQVKERIARYNIQRSDSVYLFINVTNFKVYNDQKGFEQGNEFLKTIGQILSDVFNNLALICRQSDDHFIVFTYNKDIEEKINAANERIESLEPDIKPSILVGAYEVYNPLDDPHYAVEKARYAYAELKRRNMNKRILYYDEQMHDNYLMVQYVVTHIDEAIEKGYLKAFYQPVVWSKGRALCGAEALARWIDPKYGFLSPAKFVPALENARLIYKLDKEILRLVCSDIRHNLDSGLPVLPVSINFSRADFGLIDIVEVVTETVEQYQVPHELLHIEITESALTDEEDTLKTTIIRLHENGFATWLDDFGSGYSSFNVLKDYEFDVLKLDMKFLTGFEGNNKSRALIRSVINMADQIGMKTLCEGVETMEQAAFLEEASCGRLQGYLYGKPLSYQEIMDKISNGEFELSDDILVRKAEA